MDQEHIRNFSIIAHIDHGKSTLSDRLLELTGTIDKRLMVEQVLDTMALERERGITIKAQAARMQYHAHDGEVYQLNLIDTPGHVDFTYEVSRSLAACEGAILVVDASQGIEAQTLANTYLAMEHDLVLIPVINKIDLPGADPVKVAKEIEDVIGLPEKDIILASAKEGIGTEEILEAIVRRVPPPHGSLHQPLRALIFDSKYDAYKGVVAFVRVFDGEVSTGSAVRMMETAREADALELGVFAPSMTPVPELSAGEVGYIATGLKTVGDCHVGDTITLDASPADSPLPGYRPPKPMVFAGIYPMENTDYGLLRDALEKLHLNDAALIYEPETSMALGFGFRCGFLGLLHMDIVQERLWREYGLSLMATAPSVEYIVTTTTGDTVTVDNPAALPPPEQVATIAEPWMKLSIVSPARYIGQIMELVTGRRGVYERMEYIEEGRVVLSYAMPLSEMLTDFYDLLKSYTQGYASMDYSFWEYRPGDLVKLDILVHGDPVDALSLIVPREHSYRTGRELVHKLRGLIPRHLFEVAIQAAIGSKIIARESVAALRKDVLAKCYGGDVTRKRKLLEKQAEGKKRMKQVGQVEIPQEAFMAVLKLGGEEG
jgi:GTP-binding protein LepA